MLINLLIFSFEFLKFKSFTISFVLQQHGFSYYLDENLPFPISNKKTTYFKTFPCV